MYNTNWKPPHLDEYDHDLYEDYIHVDELANYEDIKDWVKEILQHVYITGDIQLFEGGLEELCALLDVKMPKTPMKLQKKGSDLFRFAAQLSGDYAATITK